MTPEQETPLVFIVDDDSSMLDSLSFLIGSVGITAKTFSRAEEFLNNFSPDTHGCILMDVRMPGMSGLDVQQLLFERNVTMPLVIMTGHADVQMAVRALKLGAYDFLEKPFSDQVLIDTVQAAIDHDARVRQELSQTAELQGRLDLLTARENEVMEFVISGNSNRQIAEQLGLSEKTIEVHRAHVMQKMHAKNAADLTRMVLSVRTASAD